MKSKSITTSLAIFIALFSLSNGIRAQQQIGASTNDRLRQDQPILLRSNLVSLTVNVTDAQGRSVPGLAKDAFTVLDENIRQEISYFSNEDSPASVAIVFDVSASMNEAKIRSAKEALAQFIQTSHREDEYFLIGFDSTAHLLLDGVRDGAAVLKKFAYVQTHGNTALYDAVYMGLEKLSRGAFAKRAMILISDGEDNHSLYTFNELRHRLQESDIAIYTIQIGIPLVRSGASNRMSELALISGGKAFPHSDRQGMCEAFEQIALELRQQYSLAFFPTNFQMDDKKRRIKILVTPPVGLPRLAVRHRKSYTAAREAALDNPD